MDCISKRCIITILASFTYAAIFCSITVTPMNTANYYVYQSNYDGLLFVILPYFLSFPAGIFVTRYGGATVIGVAMIINAFLEFIQYTISSMELFKITQPLTCLCQVFALCAFPDIWARWSPSNERSTRISVTYSGSFFIATILLAIEYYSYNLTNGVALLICGLLWVFFIKNDPQEDSSLSLNEKQYLNQTNDIVDHKRQPVTTYPFKSILTSKPLWTLIAISFASQINFIFVSEARNSVVYCKTLASLLHFRGEEFVIYPIACFVLYSFFGYLADVFKRQSRNSTQIRKLYICSGFGLLATAFILFSIKLGSVYFLLELAILISRSLIDVACWVNLIELSPKYASILMGIQSTTSALIIITGELIWSNTYGSYGATVLCAYAALLYYFFGSSELQPWDRSATEEEELRKRQNA